MLQRTRRDEAEEQNLRRVRFWHQGGTCLQACVEWAFPGMLSNELLERICVELIEYVEKRT